jgi:hypothetical protein
MLMMSKEHHASSEVMMCEASFLIVPYSAEYTERLYEKWSSGSD